MSRRRATAQRVVNDRACYRQHRESARGSARMSRAAALKLAAAIKGSDPLDRKPPTLREYSKGFLQWVETGRLEADSRRYYRNGWRLLEQTKIAAMHMDQISKDEIEKLKFPGSASNGNNALRTLRRMYSKGMRVKNVDFDAVTIFTPDNKTESGRRFIPMSSRVKRIIEARCARRSEGWVWMSRYKGKHIGEGMVYRQWARARQAAGLPRELVLYCARTFGFGFKMPRDGKLRYTYCHSVKTAGQASYGESIVASR